MEKPIRCATSLDEIIFGSEKTLSSSSSALSSSTCLTPSPSSSSNNSINSIVENLKRAVDSEKCTKKQSDKDKDYAELKESLRSNFKKRTAEDQDEMIVGNLDARHAIEQAFLNDVIPDDLQWQAILLAGLPGLGKTKIMNASATKIAKLKKTPVSVVVVKAGDLYNKYLGQTEKTPQALYQVAREEKPSIILIDEVDGLMRSRSDNESDQSRRFKNALLHEIQGAHTTTGVLTICSTNRPADIDKGFLRRFSKIFVLGVPSFLERIQLFKKYLDQYNEIVPVNYDQINFDYISKYSEGFTGDDIRKVVSLAANNNCKISSDGQLLSYKKIETIRKKLESSLEPIKIVAIPIESHHLVKACKMIGISYQPKDIKELNQFAADNKLTISGSSDSRTSSQENIQKELNKNHETDDCSCDFYNLCNPC